MKNGVSFRRRIITGACAFVLGVIPASAVLRSGGVETFDGNTIDTDIWRVIEPESISQNNALFFNAADNLYQAQLTTRNIALGVGSLAQVELTFTGRTSLSNWTQYAYIGLTTASSKDYIGRDSYAIQSELELDPQRGTLEFSGLAAIFTEGGTSTGWGKLMPLYLNTRYILRIERLSSTLVRHSVLNSSYSVLGQGTSTVPAFTDPLYLALGGGEGERRF